MRNWLFLTLIFFTSCMPQKEEKLSGIICFGDSITQGVGVTLDRAYPQVLAQLLNRPVVNAGITGDTTYNALTRLERDVIARRPAIVIVEFGGNDWMRGIPLENTLRNLGEIITRIRITGAKVFLCDIASGFWLHEYRVPFKELALRTEVIFLPDIMENIMEGTEGKSDIIHPNAAGYKTIAQRIHKQLIKYCKFDE